MRRPGARTRFLAPAAVALGALLAPGLAQAADHLTVTSVIPNTTAGNSFNVTVEARNSDNTKIQRYLGWEPSIRLRDGMAKTYAWIREQYLAERASVVA